MSINDFVEMTIFLCLISFSIYGKMQDFVDECVLFFFFLLYAEIQEGRQKWRKNYFGEKSSAHCRYPVDKKFC